jgi:hypothetical protein
MLWKVDIHPLVNIDVLNVEQYYKSISSVRMLDFEIQLTSTYIRIRENPENYFV